MLPLTVGWEESQRGAGEAWRGGRSQAERAGDGPKWKRGHIEERVAEQPAESRGAGEADGWAERRDRCAGGHRPEQPGWETGTSRKVTSSFCHILYTVFMMPSLKRVREGIEDDGSDPQCAWGHGLLWGGVHVCSGFWGLTVLAHSCSAVVGSMSRVNKWMSLRGLGSSHVAETEECWCSNFWVLRSKRPWLNRIWTRIP